MFAKGDDRARQFGDGEDVVDQASGNGVARHLAVLGLARFLDETDAAFFLDSLEPHRAVGARARQHHRDGLRSMGVGEGTKEDVDRRPALLDPSNLGDVEMAVDHGETAVGRDDVDAVGLDPHARLHLRDGHRCRHLDDLGQMTFMLWRQVDDDDERHPAVRRHVAEERLERSDASRGSAKPNYGKFAAA